MSDINEPKKAEIKLSAHELEIQRLELEAKQLEVKLKTLQFQDLEEQIMEREAKRANKSERSRTNGATLKQLAVNDRLTQERCNHKKGGNGAEGILAGQGDDSQYAILKHKFANGDWWVRCLRCGKTYKPPMEEWYETKGEYDAALAEYQEALKFYTKNSPSSCVPMQWGDGGKYYRKVMRYTTLR